MSDSQFGKTRFKILLSILVLLLLFAGAGLVSFLKHFVPRGTVVKLVVEGDIVEEPRAGIPFLHDKTESMKDLTLTLDTAAHDPRVSGLVVIIKPFHADFHNYPVPAKVQELREGINEVKKAGKWTAAYLEDTDPNGYYLASACKEIFILPTSAVVFNGISLQSVFLKGFLDKLGIKPEFQHIGQYKTASNILTKKGFTPAHKAMDMWLMNSLYGQLVADIAASRGISEKKVAELMDTGVFFDREAVKSGLVDKLAYPEELEPDLTAEHGAGRWMAWTRYLAKASGKRWGSGKKIAIVYACGTIAGEENGYSLLEGRTIGSEPLRKTFARIRKDPSIKAVVFRINSPGGEVLASEIIRHAANLTAMKIPVVVSMSDVAASGGYWMSMFDSPPVIVADPATLTGSIGVLGGKFDLKDFYAKLGVHFQSVSRGKLALIGSSTDFSPAQKALFTAVLQHTYEQFVARVAHDRHMTEKAVNRIGQGKVFTGEQAKKNGLVDRLGGLLDAIAVAKNLAAIKSDQPVNLIVYPKPKTLLEQLLGEWQENSHVSLTWPWRPGEALVYMR